MTTGVERVAVVGGGIAGASAAFALAREGAAPTLIERHGVASEASSRNPGGLNPLLGAGIPGPLHAFALESHRLTMARLEELRARSGVAFRGGPVTRVHIALDSGDRADLEPMYEIQQATPGFSARWLDRGELVALEPRVAPDAVGALRVEGNARVDAAAYTRSVAAAAVSLGATFVTGDVIGLRSDGDRVTGVELASGVIPCDGVIIATGVWVEGPASWLGVRLPVAMHKGELLFVEIDGEPLAHTFARNDASIYGDGTNTVCIGGTESKTGFDTTPTPEARSEILAKAKRLFPAIETARVVGQIAGVRAVTPDRLPIVGAAPGWSNVWLALGGGRKGLLLGAAMGEAVGELATRGETRYSIAGLTPDRWSEAGSDHDEPRERE